MSHSLMFNRLLTHMANPNFWRNTLPFLQNFEPPIFVDQIFTFFALENRWLSVVPPPMDPTCFGRMPFGAWTEEDWRLRDRRQPGADRLFPHLVRDFTITKPFGRQKAVEHDHL